MNHRFSVFCCTVLSSCMLFASGAALAEAGRVQSLSGSASVVRNAQTQTLSEGAVIESGDLLQTGADATLNLRMVNGEEISLRPGTQFTVERFSRPKSADKPETGRSFYSLLKGGFRAITRSLGRRGLDSYRINTPVATIGIRGSTIIVAHDSANGTGLGVEEGGAFIKNKAGTLDVSAGGFGEVGKGGGIPGASTGMPAALKNAGFGPAGPGSDRLERPETGDRPLRIERPEPALTPPEVPPPPPPRDG